MSLATFSTVMGTVLCAYLVLQGQMTVGLLLAATLYMESLAGNIGTVQQYITYILSTKKIREKLGKDIRSLRHHPAIMIFDEPTTGLDPENAHMINEFIFSQTDMTRIVISHDWSEDYLGRFDQVVAVGQG